MPLRAAYGNAVEFTTLEELDNIATDMDAMRIQSLLICERILGITHKNMLYRLTVRGAAYADSLQLQRSIDLLRLLLEVRVEHCSILHYDTCFAAQALVRMMIDWFERHKRNNNHTEYQGNALEQTLQFEDVFAVFRLMIDNISEAQDLLQIRPVYRKQQENFDRILKCIVHLIYLLIGTARNENQKKLLFCSVIELVAANIRSACTYDTLLHLCVSRLNVIKRYLADSTLTV